ncbi:chorismate synthase [Pseudoflavonifractor phocaeensis]|uniref:chorismate synthase n=1 Tax=Pseudoflavonifractor phocaeensis TaxID=1870988 RepID=UPI001F35E1CC|nr:chorismate synthase [Pseudoflavonifractor phocaeensis]MCF2661321.1 chorismate synthase [Pseudoflavonifractor phocaeensis]
MSSYLGKNLHVAIFGQSHSEAIGVTVDGLPAGEAVDLEELDRFLQRRAPGRTDTSTPRKEADKPRILCGLADGVTCGAPLAAVIENTNTRSRDYDKLKDVPRPGHADYTAQVRYGGFQDVRGGGHFSGRLTAPLCVAGGIALQILARRGIQVAAHILRVGEVTDRPFDPMGEQGETLDRVRRAPFPVLDQQAGERMRKTILEAREQRDSVGGVVECMITGLPAGVGDPMFGGMESRMASVLFGIPAVKGVEFGSGFGAARMRGSEHNDPFGIEGGQVVARSNHAGGILGGITSGMPILFRCAFKPTPSISKEQDSVSLSRMEPEKLVVEGRHDPCIVPRAVPVVEAAAALVVLDALLDGPAKVEW